ncbi:uncharacterized protein [Physcomitrium patens]|uniref:Uncharacterized protein n=1 Tax=Physcomitrium patens TaxID=3218 RepID=A0A2K1J2K3_PHYPA|nr:uncharacterized protein LOC112294696 [Physcomitrium patens]PNR35758.1 hypothetical protein PHYPA_021608 [Physcomitrium patens]|eukprot:XP_024401216.1 uncharacterized protein LOC112294696 [Physcomitrella patens]
MPSLSWTLWPFCCSSFSLSFLVFPSPSFLQFRLCSTGLLSGYPSSSFGTGMGGTSALLLLHTFSMMMMIAISVPSLEARYKLNTSRKNHKRFGLRLECFLGIENSEDGCSNHINARMCRKHKHVVKVDKDDLGPELDVIGFKYSLTSKAMCF